MAHLQTVDNRTLFLDKTQLGLCKSVADDVRGDILDTLANESICSGFDN